jgi:hypothetical protein
MSSRSRGYVRYGNSTVQFDQIVKHADRRLALLLAHGHQRAWWCGRKRLHIASMTGRLQSSKLYAITGTSNSPLSLS